MSDWSFCAGGLRVGAGRKFGGWTVNLFCLSLIKRTELLDIFLVITRRRRHNLQWIEQYVHVRVSCTWLSCEIGTVTYDAVFLNVF